MEKLSSISIGRGKEGGAGSVFTVRGGERVNDEEGLGYSDRKKRSQGGLSVLPAAQLGMPKIHRLNSRDPG